MASERWRVFLDANALIAGTASQTGASAAILDLGEADELTVVVSQQVLMEADRTLVDKFPQSVVRYRSFIKNLAPNLADDPPPPAVEDAARVIHRNDAPILAAAKHASVDYLVTLNTRHFMTPRVRAFFPSPIVTPAEFLAAFRTFWSRLG